MANPKKKENFLKRIGNYVSDCYTELRYKVTWPTKKELSSSSVLVLVASLVFSLFLFLVDKGLDVIVSNIYKLII